MAIPRNLGDPAFSAAPAQAEVRKFLSEKLEKGKFRATGDETELTVFLRDLARDQPASGAELLKEVADKVVEAAEALKSR